MSRPTAIYYSVVLVPFLSIGAGVGAMVIFKRRPVAAVVVLAGAVLAGSGRAGYSLRPWRPEILSVSRIVASLSSEPVLLVQSGLYPHAGYDGRVQLLTPDAVADPRNAGAAILLAPAIGAYPFSAEELTALTRLPAVRANDDGVMVVRLVKSERREPFPRDRGNAPPALVC